MKKIIKLAALLLVLLLCGCGTAAGEAASTEVGGEAASTEADAAGATESTAESTAPENVALQGLPLVSSEVSGGLFIFDRLSFEPRERFDYQDGLLVAISYPDENGIIRFALIDMITGDITESEIANIGNDSTGYPYHSIRLLRGCPVFVNLGSGDLFVFDQALNRVDRISVGSVSVISRRLGDILILYDIRSDQLIQVELDTDRKASATPIPIDLEDGTTMNYPLAFLTEDQVIVSAHNSVLSSSECILVDLAEGTGRTLFDDTYISVSALGGNIITFDYDTCMVNTYSPDGPVLLNTFYYPPEARPVIGNDGAQNLYFCTEGEQSTVLSRHDPLTGARTAEIDLAPAGFTSVSYVFEDGERVFFSGCADGKTVLCCWQPDTTEAPESFEAQIAELRADNESLILKFQEEYGVTVHGESGSETIIDGHFITPGNNIPAIHSALVALDSFFAKLPEGLTQEMIDRAGLESIDIYLSNGLPYDFYTSESISSITTIAGFAQDMGRRQALVLDVTAGELNVTISHIFMHMLENVMDRISWAEPKIPYERMRRWESLNPSDFTYLYGYPHYYENSISEYFGSTYTYNVDRRHAVDDVFFVDEYAASSPKEDRARIFEILTTCTADTLPEYFESQNLQRKAAYLCCCLKDIFHSVADADSVFWEEFVDPQYDLTYFKENYEVVEYWSDMPWC